MSVKIERAVVATLSDNSTVVLKPHVVELIENLITFGKRIDNTPAIPVIKFLRNEYGIGLRDAKEIFDTLKAELSNRIY